LHPFFSGPSVKPGPKRLVKNIPCFPFTPRQEDVWFERLGTFFFSPCDANTQWCDFFFLLLQLYFCPFSKFFPFRFPFTGLALLNRPSQDVNPANLLNPFFTPLGNVGRVGLRAPSFPFFPTAPFRTKKSSKVSTARVLVSLIFFHFWGPFDVKFSGLCFDSLGPSSSGLFR